MKVRFLLAPYQNEHLQQLAGQNEAIALLLHPFDVSPLRTSTNSRVLRRRVLRRAVGDQRGQLSGAAPLRNRRTSFRILCVLGRDLKQNVSDLVQVDDDTATHPPSPCW